MTQVSHTPPTDVHQADPTALLRALAEHIRPDEPDPDEPLYFPFETALANLLDGIADHAPPRITDLALAVADALRISEVAPP